MSILTIVGFFTNLFNIGGFVDWITEIFYKMLLFLDGVAYLLLAYSFKVFQLMCTLNFNSLYGLISGVLTRIEALIMVFVIYKLGITLIQFMLKPEEAAKKGKEILINIFITAALLLSYNTIFTLFNELSMLIIGTPENYNFVVLGQIAEVTGGSDTGLINRVVFGTDEQIPDVGEFIAFSVCSTFITDSKDPLNTTPLNQALSENGHINFMKLNTIANKIGKSFDYFPVVGFIGAIYMIYSFIKTTIQVGVRAFKLLILQVLAPIAIITVIGEGTKGKTFKNFINKYVSVYIEVFIRMFSMLLICNFVVKFIRNITDYFPSINSDEWYTIALMILLLLVAAFKFAGDIPKFIDEILSTHLGDGKKFGNFVGGLLGAGLGAAGGFIGGIAGGGFGAGLAGLASGAVKGAQSGAKGNSVAEFFKGQNQVRKDAKVTGQGIAAKGGLIQTGIGAVQGAVGVGNRQDKKLAKLDRQSAALDALDAAEKFAVKDAKMSKGDTWQDSNGVSYDASGYSAGFNDVKLGEDKDSYAAKMANYDTAYQSAQSHYDYLNSDSSSISPYESAYSDALKEYNGIKQADFVKEVTDVATGSTKKVEDTDAYNAAKYAKLTELNKTRRDLKDAQSRREAELSDAKKKLEEARVAAENKAKSYYDHRKQVEGDNSPDVLSKRKAYTSLAGKKSSAAGADRTAEKRRIYGDKADITNRSSYARTHGQNPKNK